MTESSDKFQSSPGSTDNFRELLDKAPINLAQLVSRAFIWIDSSLKSQLVARGWPEITRPQVMVFVTIVEGHTRPSDIAHSIGVSRQAVHQTLGELINMDLIELKPDSKDGRAKIVSATEKGRELARDSLQAMSKAEKELANRIGEGNIKHLRTALEQDWGEALKSHQEAN